MKEYITEIVKVISNTCKSEMIYISVRQNDIKYDISSIQKVYDLRGLNDVRRQRNNKTLRQRIVIEREYTAAEIKAYLKVCKEVAEKEELKKLK